MSCNFYPIRKHPTCVETFIRRHNFAVKPYYFCGDGCPITVERAAAELREFVRGLNKRGIDVWGEGQDIYIAELGKGFQGPYETLEES